MKSWIGPLSLLALIAALVVVGTAGASHRATSPVKGSFKYCSDPTFPPMESKTSSGKPVGFDVDLANAIARLWRVKATHTSTAFPEKSSNEAGLPSTVVFGSPYLSEPGVPPAGPGVVGRPRIPAPRGASPSR